MQLEMRPPGHRCDLSGGLAQQGAMMQVLVAQSSTDVTLMGFSEIWLRVAGCEQYCPKKLADSLKAAQNQALQISMLPDNSMWCGVGKRPRVCPHVPCRSGSLSGRLPSGSCTHSTYALKSILWACDSAQEGLCSKIQSESYLLPAVSQSAWAGPAVGADRSSRGGGHRTAAG